MKLQAKLTLVAAAMTALFLPVVLPAANAIPVTGQATITAASCGIVTVGAQAGDLISFGSLSTGGTSTEQSLVLDNTGTTNGRLFVSGANWRGTVGAQVVDVMDVRQTHYSTTNTADYASKTALTSTPVDTLTDITPATNLTTEWQLQVALLPAQPSFTGSVTQAITLTTSC
jgi:hypothetical protein